MRGEAKETGPVVFQGVDVEKEHTYIDILTTILRNCPVEKRFELLAMQDSKNRTAVVLAVTIAFYWPERDMTSAYIKVMEKFPSCDESCIEDTQLNQMGFEFINRLILACPQPKRFDLLRVQDSEGKNALMLALENKNLAAALVMRHHCPRMDLLFLADKHGKTAFDVANYEGEIYEKFLYGFASTMFETVQLMKKKDVYNK